MINSKSNSKNRMTHNSRNDNHNGKSKAKQNQTDSRNYSSVGNESNSNGHKSIY